MTVISIERLITVRSHLGHMQRKKNPKMNQYIFGNASGMSIIDVRFTLQKLKEAYQFCIASWRKWEKNALCRNKILC